MHKAEALINVTLTLFDHILQSNQLVACAGVSFPAQRSELWSIRVHKDGCDDPQRRDELAQIAEDNVKQLSKLPHKQTHTDLPGCAIAHVAGRRVFVCVVGDDDSITSVKKRREIVDVLTAKLVGEFTIQPDM